MNYACSVLEPDKFNPFSRLIIKGEGHDRLKRGVFVNGHLNPEYHTALASGSEIKPLMPLLGETGCRLAEIVGLRLEDIDLENDLIHIRPNAARRLKTPNSQDISTGWICKISNGKYTRAVRRRVVIP